jgi:hypothetical protein
MTGAESAQEIISSGRPYMSEGLSREVKTPGVPLCLALVPVLQELMGLGVRCSLCFDDAHGCPV